MKKLMFGIAGVMAVLVSASAGTVTEEQCNKSSKMFWVKFSGECVPRNVCDSMFKGKYDDDYCVRDFADAEVATVEVAENASKYYLENSIGSEKGINCHIDVPGAGDKESVFGQNFIPCITADGRYIVFEFDDTTDTAVGDKVYLTDVYKPLCKSLGGKENKMICSGLTEKQCEILGNQMKSLSEISESGFVFVTSFNDTTKDCKMLRKSY